MSKHSNLFAYITSDSIWSVLDMHVTTVSGFVFIWLEKISTSRYLKARFFFFLFYFFFPLSLSRLTHSIHRAPSHRPIEPRTQTTWSRATTAMQCRQVTVNCDSIICILLLDYILSQLYARFLMLSPFQLYAKFPIIYIYTHTYTDTHTCIYNLKSETMNSLLLHPIVQ